MKNEGKTVSMMERTSETLWRQLEQEFLSLPPEKRFVETAGKLREALASAGSENSYGSFFGYCMDLAERRTEIRLVVNETIRCMLRKFSAGQTMPEKEALLSWQPLIDAASSNADHHDRLAQIDYAARLSRLEKGSDRISEQDVRSFTGPEGARRWAPVMNPYPIRRAMFTCIRADGPLRVFDGDREIPAQFIHGDGAIAIEIELDGFSLHTLRLEKNGTPCVMEDMSADGYTFQNDRMKVHVMPDGRIASLTSLQTGEVFDEAGGNILQAELVSPDGKTLLTGVATGNTRIEKGPLFDNVFVEGMLGDSRYNMIMYLPHGTSQRIEIMTDLYASPRFLESMRQEGSTVRTCWHTCLQDPVIRKDGPFGCAEVAKEENILSANGVTVTENGHGFLYDHQGVTRSYFKDQTLISVWGVGGDEAMQDLPGGNLDARTPDDPCRASYRFFNAIDLTDSDNAGDMFSRILYYQIPMFPIAADQYLPDQTLFNVNGHDLIFTGTFSEGGKTYVRFWNTASVCVPVTWSGSWKVLRVIGEDGRSMTDEVQAKPHEILMFVLE